MSEEKYRSYELPVFRTARTNTADYLLASGVTLIGVEGGSENNTHTFKFAVSGGKRAAPIETAKLAAAFESGRAPDISDRALDNAHERLRAAVLDFDHIQAIR